MGLPFLGLILTLVVVDKLNVAFANNLYDGIPPWRIKVTWFELIDVPLIPLVLPIYFLYEQFGVKSLLICLLPVAGELWLVKRLFDEASQRQDTVDLLDLANELIASSLSLKDMAERIADQAMRIFNAGGAEVFIKTSRGIEILGQKGASPWSSKPPTPDFIEAMERLLPQAPLRFESVQKDTRFTPYKNEALSSLLFLPLVSGKSTLGFLICTHPSSDFFFPDQAKFWKVLGGQLSNAIVSAKLHEKLVATLKELQETQAQLVQSEKMAGLGKLVAGVAHELNNPLNFLSLQVPILQDKVTKLEELVDTYQAYEASLPQEDRSMLSELKRNLEAPELPAYFQKSFAGLEEGINRSKLIIDNLRTFARTESLEGSFDYVDLNEALDSTLMVLTGLHDSRVVIHKEYGTIPKLWCNAPQINQVLMNLLSNAFDAIEGEGEVWIATTGTDKSIEIKIRDSGIGIPKELQSRIFEPFFTTKEVGKGTGLGLSIVYSIVKQHHGDIQVESQEGHGATFTVILPVTEPT